MPVFFALPKGSRGRFREATAWLLWAMTMLIGVPAFAIEPLQQAPRSPLEQSLIDEALEHFGWQEDPNPDGKVIEEIEVYVYPVFDHRDPIPRFVNVFHSRTKDWVIRQDVIHRAGERWELGRVLETERNLRALRQLSLANVVAARGSAPDRVKMLVVVKDVWSLRLNSDWEYGSSGLDLLVLQPTEENLAGIRASLGSLFVLERDRYYVGGSFGYPRMFGTNYSVGLSGGAIFNRFSSDSEGAYGSFSFARPLRFRRDRWAFGTDASWATQIARQYRKGQIDQVVVQTATGSEAVPLVYEAESIQASYWGVRSYGISDKFQVGFGLELDHRRYRVPEFSEASSEANEFLRDRVLPVSDRRISPYVSLSAFSTRYHRVLNVETLGIQEDWRSGYGLSTSLFSAAESIGSSRNLVGSRVSAGYTLPISNGLVRIGVANRIVVANESRHEAFASLRGRFVSPQTLAGRLHFDGYLGHRYYDYLNVAPFRLGGNNRLRGYAAGEFDGTDLVVANAEWRTGGVDILSAQVGLAFFYDVGAASDIFSAMEFYQGAGGGFRILFPQAERTTLRLDWGLPLSGDRDVFPGAFFFTFGQAFPMPDPSGGGEPY